MKKIYLIAISLLIIPPAFAADNIVHGGAIARSPALVVADTRDHEIGWPSWWIAVKAKEDLKRAGYKIYSNKLLNCESGNDVIHRGLENSSVFVFVGHGSDISIGSNSDLPASWVIYLKGNLRNITNDEVEHNSDPALILIRDDQYRFVFLDACETAWGSAWANAFDTPDSDRGKVFLGWRVGVYDEPGWYPNRVFNPYTYLGADHPRWARCFWEHIGDGRTVEYSRQKAGESWKTKNVEKTFGFRTIGDSGLKLK